MEQPERYRVRGSCARDAIPQLSRLVVASCSHFFRMAAK